MGAPVCHGSDWSECHADINSDTAAVTKITNNLERPFSMIAKEQSSMMDYWVTYSIHPVWTVRFATIVQRSSSSLADSIVWIVRLPAVVSQTTTHRDWLSLFWKSETMWAWYHWIASLVARNGSEMTCYWIAASEQWTIPKCPVFVLGCSFPRVEQSTSLRSIQMEG